MTESAEYSRRHLKSSGRPRPPKRTRNITVPDSGIREGHLVWRGKTLFRAKSDERKGKVSIQNPDNTQSLSYTVSTAGLLIALFQDPPKS